MSQAISAGIATANQFDQTAREAKGDALGKSDFLLLLVTQFKYQDPLNPMDDKEFVAQLSQFSSLEQLMNLNTSMESLTAATQDQQMMNAVSYIGKDVAASGSSIAKKDGHVGKFYWAADGEVAKGTLYVYDQDLNQIYGEQFGPKSAGTTTTFEWSGRNYMGAQVPDGVYYIRIACEDAAGQTLLVDTRVTGRVEGVATEQGEIYLRLDDGRVVALKNVHEIAAAANVQQDTDTDTGAGTGTGTDTGSDISGGG
jgi:flagellar basal-body rod modification protein FlgD